MCNRILVTEGEERILEADFPTADLLYVVFDVFRIRGNDRAVVMIACALYFVTFIK